MSSFLSNMCIKNAPAVPKLQKSILKKIQRSGEKPCKTRDLNIFEMAFLATKCVFGTRSVSSVCEDMFTVRRSATGVGAHLTSLCAILCAIFHGDHIAAPTIILLSANKHNSRFLAVSSV